MFDKNLSIVVPSYNEEGTLNNVVSNCIKFGHVVVINDCSDDNSIKNLKKLNLRNLKILNNFNRLGYDASINNGINYALKHKFKYIITYDADNQFYFKDINNFVKYLKKGYQIVIGVRPSKQRFIENFFSFILEKNYKIKDPFCGFKAYNRKIFKQNKSYFTYNSIGTEILLCYLNDIKKIKQINIKIKLRSDKSRFGNILTGNYKLLLAIIKGYKIIK